MAGSCIGVILLVMTLELFRRASKEYDRYIIQTARSSAAVATAAMATTTAASPPTYSSEKDIESFPKVADIAVTHTHAAPVRGNVKVTILQQAVRATLHMVQFMIAYFVMLLAMYYNGYLIISIFIGAWLGGFAFSWGNMDIMYVFHLLYCSE